MVLGSFQVSCSQAAKSSEDMTAQLESVAAAVEAAGGITASSSGTCSDVLSTSRFVSPFLHKRINLWMSDDYNKMDHMVKVKYVKHFSDEIV